jgi:pyridoxal phosphate enzyme (YggS family)
MASIEEVRRKIAQACEKAGRSPEDIRIVAASKTQDIDAIKNICNQGIVDFGENRAQELFAKAPQLSEATWHFIGQIQTNKLKKIAQYVDYIHSIDSTKQIDMLAALESPPKIFIQYSADGNEDRGGISEENLTYLINHARDKNIDVVGLMVVPPLAYDARDVFEHTRELAQQFDLPELSMGMSADYETAIECGATMVRLGSVLFGERAR